MIDPIYFKEISDEEFELLTSGMDKEELTKCFDGATIPIKDALDPEVRTRYLMWTVDNKFYKTLQRYVIRIRA